MSAAEDGYDPSIWEDPENNPRTPKKCPICDRALAHPEDLRDNEDIDCPGLFVAYRRHRQAHYPWGDDPRKDGAGNRDPYLGSYYNTNRDALWEPEDGPAGDPDEIVGHVFDVTIHYQAQAKARVVAPDKHRSKEKAEELRVFDAEDLTGWVPTVEIMDDVHTDTYKRKDVTRAENDLAERMEGWPW